MHTAANRTPHISFTDATRPDHHVAVPLTIGRTTDAPRTRGWSATFATRPRSAKPSPRMADSCSMTVWKVSDGVIEIRATRRDDVPALIAGRDDEFRRWFGPGSDNPSPTACIERNGEVIGWVDYERGHSWLAPGEVNVGYNVFAAYRRRGYATRAVMLLLHRIAIEGTYDAASVLIERENAGSIVVAERARFGDSEQRGDNVYLMRRVPPLVYGDGVVSIRRLDPADVDRHVAGIDEEQIRWLWQPGEREAWEAMSATQRREHCRTWLSACRDEFGSGPRWSFAVDTGASPYVAFVGVDLCNADAPAGEANLSYSCHPEHRGQGYASRAVRLALRFVAEHTGARRAHILVEEGNVPSLGVARSVAAREATAFTSARGQSMLRFVIDVDAPR